MNFRDLFSPQRIFIHPEFTSAEALLQKMAVTLFDRGGIPSETYSISAERVGQNSEMPGAVFYFYCTGKDTPLTASLSILSEPVHWPEEKHKVSLVFLFSQPGEKPGYPLEMLSQLSRLLIRGESAENILRAGSVQEVMEIIGDDSVLKQRTAESRRKNDSAMEEQERRESPGSRRENDQQTE